MGAAVRSFGYLVNQLSRPSIERISSMNAYGMRIIRIQDRLVFGVHSSTISALFDDIASVRSPSLNCKWNANKLMCITVLPLCVHNEETNCMFVAIHVCNFVCQNDFDYNRGEKKKCRHKDTKKKAPLLTSECLTAYGLMSRSFLLYVLNAIHLANNKTAFGLWSTPNLSRRVPMCVQIDQIYNVDDWNHEKLWLKKKLFYWNIWCKSL